MARIPESRLRARSVARSARPGVHSHGAASPVTIAARSSSNSSIRSKPGAVPPCSSTALRTNTSSRSSESISSRERTSLIVKRAPTYSVRPISEDERSTIGGRARRTARKSEQEFKRRARDTRLQIMRYRQWLLTRQAIVGDSGERAHAPTDNPLTESFSCLALAACRPSCRSHLSPARQATKTGGPIQERLS